MTHFCLLFSSVPALCASTRRNGWEPGLSEPQNIRRHRMQTQCTCCCLDLVLQSCLKRVQQKEYLIFSNGKMPFGEGRIFYRAVCSLANIVRDIAQNKGGVCAAGKATEQCMQAVEQPLWGRRPGLRQSLLDLGSPSCWFMALPGELLDVLEFLPPSFYVLVT